MSPKSIRFDRPSHQISYPAERDAKGYARLSFQNQRYHFGRYGSPESYAAFALWRATIDRTGDAPDIASIKPAVQSFLASEPSRQPVYTTKWLAASIVAASVSLGLCVLLAVQNASRTSPPEVDGIAMSESELIQVRATRDYETKRDARMASPKFAAETAELMDLIKREGISGAPKPPEPFAWREVAKPALPDIPGGDIPGSDSGHDEPSSDSQRK